MGTLLWGMLFGAVGMGYLVYARRQREIMPLVSGVGLMLFPYLTSNVYALVAVGALLMALPFYVEL